MEEAITFAHCQVIDKSGKGLVGKRWLLGVGVT